MPTRNSPTVSNGFDSTTKTPARDRPNTHDATPHTEHAWKLIAEALHTGQFTMGDGTTRRDVETKQLVSLVKWLASLNASRKRHTIPLPEAFQKLVG